MTIGIYEIENIKTGQKYRGQSINIERRLKEHERCKDSNQWIDRAIKSKGSDSFTCKILETFSEYDKEILNEREKYWISEGNTFTNPFHYNLTPGGDGFGGQDEHPNYRFDLNDNEIIDLYINYGFTIEEVAEKLNAHPSTISKRLRDNNIRINHCNSRKKDRLIIDLYVNQQLSTRKIAKIFNTTHQTIQRHLMSNNIILRNNKRNDIPSSKELLDEYLSNNITQKELAQKYDCSRRTIARRLKEAKEVI